MSNYFNFARKPLSVAVASLCVSLPVFAEEVTADEQMVITATRTEISLDKAPASMSVITQDEIMAEPGVALNDLVKNVAGVESTMDGGRAGREMISIRGMDSKFTMILVDGRKLSSSNAIFRGNDFDLSMIPKDSIERIEVIRGPMSALYGSEALGGVINVITKGPSNEWHSQLSSDASFRDDDNGAEYSTGFNTGGALIDDELFMSFSVNKSSRDEWNAFSGMVGEGDSAYDRSEGSTLEERDTLAMTGGLLWYINEDHDLAFDFSYADDDREGTLESTSGLLDSETHVKRNTQALTYNGSFNWGEALVRYNRDAVVSEDNYNSKNAEQGLYDIDETNQSVYAHATTYLGAHTLTVGGEFNNSKLVNPDSLTVTGETDVSQQALFVQDQWELTDSTTLTYGTRVDFHEQFGAHWSPRAYIVNTVTDKLTIKGGVGTAFNAPSLLQLSEENIITSCKGGCLVVGNPDLAPETSVSYEVSAIYTENRWSLEAGLFRNDIKNLIDQDRENPVGGTSDLPTYTYKNIDSARVQGVELTGYYAFTNSINLNANYTFIDSEDQTTNEALMDRPDHSATARLSWAASSDLDTFARVNYTGKTLIDTDVYRPGYTTLDLGLNYTVAQEVRLRAGVRNLTSEQFDEFDVTQRGYSVLPRTWYVGLTADF
ncbi:catecholate siderophore receptor CirA [Psychromonas marina]|uniref:Catecholate siderophore receptor CirA n=1 Tax=Psychromonas marina TaxID=88364 RepID=A0ABQ6E3F2_9GAMM|nr:TonB-dependent receptor [Psychromonas marina]GLS91725.1 catecholate siderophore receptor CirA [Psychromonas marina]